MKHFIITIDTEGDNLWEHRLENTITTENARYVPRFQNLCEKYNFKPVYLVNYEMALNDYFVDFAKNTLANNACEIGIHLHAWNNPPYYELPKASDNYGLPYLIEYPLATMRKKFTLMYELLKKRIDTEITSHRSGRWAMNRDYYDILIENNIKVDCSVTPHVSWMNTKGLSPGSKGPDYIKCPEKPFKIKHSLKEGSLTEVPVSIRMSRHFSIDAAKLLHPRYALSTITNIIKGKPLWLRPNGNNLSEMLTLINCIKNSDSDYLMFMLHSSELMPGGSPKFRTEASIETLYYHLNILFNKISNSFIGITLKNYVSAKNL